MKQMVFIDFKDPYFIIFFQPNKITEHHLRELRIPGPPYQMRQDLSLIKDVNIKLMPDWTEAAMNKIHDLIIKGNDETKYEYAEFFKQMESVVNMKPFKIQIKGLWALHKNKYYGLNLEQGLGKTKIALDYFAYLKRYIDPSYKLFVTCPNGNVLTWVHEVKKHQPGTRAVALHHGTVKKLKALEQEADIYITNIEGIAPVKGKKGNFLEALISKFSTGKWYAVIDESTTIKGATSKRTKAVHFLRDSFSRRTILTGTLTPNGANDVWGQLSFLDAGATGFSSFYAFKKNFCEYANPYIPQMITGYRNQDQLKAIIDKWTLRATKEDWLDIPDKVYNRIYFTISQEQRKMLKELEEACYAEFTDEQGNTLELDKAHVLARIEAYRQIVKGFFTTNKSIIKDGEPSVLRETKRFKNLPRYACVCTLLKETLPGYPAIIWTNHIEERNIMMETMKAQGFKKFEELSNKKSAEENQNIIEKFQAGEVDYLITSLQSFYMGITVTRAKVMVFCSNTMDWLHRAQAEDRFHRIGLEHSALIYDVLAEDTYDETILKCLETKSDFSSEFIDGITRKDKRI